MARNIRITLASDHVESVQVRDNLKLSEVLLEAEDTEFLVIPTLEGGEYVLPKRSIVAIVKEGRNGAARPKRST